jgi:hypothetical protein
MYYCIIYTCESGVVVILCTPQSIIFIIMQTYPKKKENKEDISVASLRCSLKKGTHYTVLSWNFRTIYGGLGTGQE